VKSPVAPLGRRLPELILLLFALLSGSLVLGRCSSHLVSPADGPHGDAVLHVWQHWWFGRFLAGDSPLWTTDMSVFPAQAKLTGLWEGHLDLLMSLPLIPWLGPVTVNNIVTLAFLAIALTGAYLLAREVSGDRYAAAAAAMLYALSPTLLRELAQGRHEDAATGLLALALVFFGRFFRQGGARRLGAGMLCLLLAILGYLPLGPISIFVFLPLGLGYLITAEQRPWLGRGLLAALGLALAGGCALLYAWSTQGAGSFLPAAGNAEQYQAWMRVSSDTGVPLRALFAPSPWGAPGGSGLVLLVAAATTLLAPRKLRAALPWWLMAALLCLMALGPVLLDLGDGRVLYSPYARLPQVVPFWLRFHWPYRLLLLSDLALAVLAALGLARLREGLTRPVSTGVMTVILLAAALQISAYFPLPAVRMPSVPAAYFTLENEPGGALLEISASDDPSRPVYHMSWNQWLVDPHIAQLEHGRPFCCLTLPEVLMPERLQTALRQDPWLAYLMQRGPMPADEQGDLKALGFSHVALQGRHLEELSPPLAADTPQPSTPPEHRYQVKREALEQRYGPPVARTTYGDGALELYRVR
jgi:hypothetical protein